MTTVTLLEFRRRAGSVIRGLKQGQRFILSYRGEPVARMEPIREGTVAADDPIYRLADLATGGGQSLSNRTIDAVLYER